MIRTTVRLRLAAWFASAFICALAAGSFDAYRTVEHALDAGVDEGLLNRAEGTRSFIEQQLPRLSREKLAEEFEDHLVVAMGPSSGPIQVYDATGAFLYRSPAFRDAGLSMQRPDLLGSQPWLEHRTINGVPVRLLTARFEAAGRPFGVQIATVTSDNDRALAALRHRGLLFAPLLVLLACVGGYWLSSRALQPVSVITATARAINTHNLHRRLEIPETVDELQDLSITLNTMLDRLESAFTQIERFTADASHELRAPVAFIRTSAEVALRRARTADEYHQTLTEIAAEALRTSTLVEDLLLLARADRDVEHLDLAPVDFSGLLRESAEAASRLADSQRLRLEVRLPPFPVVVEADASALRRLVTILTDNAVKYTPAPGRVEWSLCLSDDVALFEVLDTGIGIDPFDLPHVFERFYRADRARSRDSGGSGLGLAIAQWIVAKHGGTISASSPERGCRITVALPVCRRVDILSA